MGRKSRRKRTSSMQGGSRRTTKLSERLVELVAPFRQTETNRDEYEVLMKLASVAWNLALFSAVDRDSALSRAVGELSVESRVALLELVARKEAMFPEDRRFIAGVQVTDRGAGQLHVTVASISDG